MYGSYLLLKNETGEKILLLPCADDLATASWNGLKNFGPIANPIGRLFPLVRAYTSLDSRKGKNLYHMYRLDARNRIVSNDAESLSYLITVQIIQGRMHDAIHTSEQLNNLLDEKENVEPDAEMVLWPLMVVPNTLEGKAALGPFNHIFHLRQKLLAKFELKCDKTKKPTNNSGFVHAIFIISLLQDLHTRIHKYRVERTPHPSDDPDQQEFLLYRTLHRHVSAIVTPDYHPVDWFESRLLPPSMAKRYRDLHLRYAGSTPNGTEHFLRDFAFSNAEPPTRSYFGAEASAFTDSPLQKMGIVEHIHSDQVNPTIWRRIHSMFRSHINAIRNPHLECASLQSTLELPRFNSSLSPSTVRTQFLHFYEIALGKNGSTARSNLYYNLRVMRGGWDLQSRTLIDLLTTVCSAALPTDKPLSTITAPLWRAWATGNSNSYQSFKWIGLHPLGIITSSIYGMVNHKIWSSNFTQAADSVTQFFGTGTNPPIDITLTSSTGALALPGHPSNQQIRMTAPLQHLNKTLQQITLEESPGRIAKIRILAKISMPPQTTEYVLFDDDLLVTHFPTPFLSSDGSPSFQIPHPLRQNYDEAIDNWPALDPRSYFPSPEILRTLIQGQLNPKCFFELLHSKVHAYKIVHTYTRPMQKGLVWLVENPFFSICGGKKGLYPLWMEIVHRAAAKALLAWRNYHVPVASNSYASLPIHFDLAELLTDENHRFERIYGKLTVKIFANGTALHRGQPLVALNAELEKLRRNLSESIVNDRKLLLKMVNPPTIRNIWRKPIDYKELLLSFFTNSYAGIMDDLKMHREQIHALQASIVRQITREIRLESIDKLLIRLNEISETGLIDLSALRLIKRFLSSHFYHTKMPEIQRHILCYEWLTGEIIQKEKLDEVKILVSDKKEYESLVRKALIKY
jgi:hypothetical protein